MGKQVEMKARVAAFTGEPRRINRVMVSTDGIVRVYDSVAGYYTTCHALDGATESRLRRKAAKVQEGSK